MSGHATINRLYRLVWSDTLGAWVAVAETTRGRGKRSGRGKLMAALFAGVAAGSLAQAAAPPVTALPTGGQVVAGTVAIGQQDATMTVTQASARGAIDWQTFNVGAAARVNFVQPSASAVTLNRVLDTQASQIHGRISANGQVFLSNPNGVYFSPTASADVGALVATTHGIDNAAFMAGGVTFERRGATGSVINDGQLTAGIGGYIALLAPAVRNNGVVLAQAGTVALASGEAISLQFDARQSLVGVLATPMQIDALVENGNAIRAPGGMIVMSAQAARQLQDGVVRNSGTLEAGSLTSRGGKIVLDSAGLVDNSGAIDASGAGGGAIAISGERMLSTGALRADGGAGLIATRLRAGLVETTSALVSANGGGGVIGVDAGAGTLYSSGTYQADGRGAGQSGGSVVLAGDNISLMGATVSASGSAGGGTILVGGDYQGASASVGGAVVANASQTRVGQGVTLKADALDAGKGGKVVVWSEQNTVFGGAISATGGATGGDGGVMEVSGKQTLHFGGTADAHAVRGVAGSLLLDPKDIYIDADLTGQLELRDPHSSAGGTFGATSTALSSISGGVASATGYLVVTNPTDDLGASSAGAAYLFRQSDQALISTLYGSNANDRVGSSGTISLTNGNFVVSSPNWGTGRGAVTFGNGSTGWGGTPTVVSSSNSLVGTLTSHTNTANATTSDSVGANATTVLPNGNYLVGSASWGDMRGALTLGNGSTGTSGVISSSNSLVGSTASSSLSTDGYKQYKAGDVVGSSISVLPNGNFVMLTPAWNKGVGAVTFGTATSAPTGVLGATTSLIGNTARYDNTGEGSGTDKVGTYRQALSGSTFLVYEASFNGYAGALTYFDDVNPVVGLLSASNSLVGGAGDALSSAGITLLGSNNAYLIRSPSWSSGRGAVTWVPYGTDVKTVSVGASLAGGTASDAIGSGAVTLLANNDYVVTSPNFNGARGASTLVDGTTGKAKADQSTVVSSVNSLVGSQANDRVGADGIVALKGNGNYVTLSPYWANGSNTSAGAVTWSSGTSPTVGAVSASNSLVGSNTGDRIGSFQYNYYGYNNPAVISAEGSSVTALSNGNYVVASPMFNSTRGAATWVNGSTGATVNGGHTIAAGNSLMGANTGDFVGGFVTYADVLINSVNNTYGHYDAVANGVTALAGGNYVTSSSYWRNGAALRAGAVSWSDGAGAPLVGAISSANSLVGTVLDDRVGAGPGNGNGLQLLTGAYDSAGNQTYTGNYVVSSASWNGAYTDGGAVTWGSGVAALTGTPTSANSVLGVRNGDVATWSVLPLPVTGNYLIQNRLWDNGAITGAGALSLVNGSTGRLSDYAAQGNRNLVSAANSLVGTHLDDGVGNYVDYLYTYDAVTNTYPYTGNYLLISSGWDNGANTDAGAISWGSGTTGVSGAISSANSITGVKTDDHVGYVYALLYNGNYVVGNSHLDVNGVSNAGGASWVDGSTGRLSDYAARGNQNLMSAANAMVGSHTDDQVGSAVTLSNYYGYGPLNNQSDTGYFIISDQWNCTAGAFTYIDAAHSGSAIGGVVGAGNSVLGNPNGSLYGGLTSGAVMTTVGDTALVTYTGAGGHVLLATTAMPTAPSMSVPNATGFADADSASQIMAPDYIAGVLRTGTNLTLQANNDIYVKSAIDASGGVAGGALTMRAGRSIAVMGDIITGNRDLTLVANDSVANGVHNAYRGAGVATISMGDKLVGGAAIIDAGTGTVSITLAAGSDKTYANAGSVGINSISGGTIKVVNQGNGLGTDLPDLLANCCGYNLGYRAAGADLVLNAGAVLRASDSGSAVTLAASDKFINSSGNAGGTIVTSDPGARWLVYAAASGTSVFGNLDSANTAVWNASYTGAPVTQAGNRYLFKYQPTVTVGTQNASKTYGDDVSTSLAASVVSLSGAQAAVAGAYLGDSLVSAISGTVLATSSGAAATASAAGSPYSITVDLSGVSGNNGYAVALGSNTPRTLTVAKKALTVTATDATKTYDGLAYSGGNGVTVNGLVNSETASVLGGTLAYGGSAQGAINVGTYTITASGYSSANYTFAYVGGQLLVNPRPLTVVTANLTGLIGKVYDGGTVATLNSSNFNLSGFINGDGASVTQTVGTYASRNVGTSSVSATLSGSNFVANNGTVLSNYTLPTSASGSGTITAKSVTLTAPTVSKTYDGGLGYVTTAGNLTSLSAALVGGDTVSAATLAFTDKNAGSGNRSVSLNSATVNDGNNGANYTVSYAGNSVSTITPRTLTVSATGVNRVYDAGTNASVTLSDDRIVGDSLSVSNTSASFANKNAGLAKAISVVGIAKAGTDSANYVLASTTASTTADIARAQLALGGVSAVNRAYDTGLSVALSGNPTVNALGGDVVVVGGSASGTVHDKNVGLSKAVTVAGYTITDTNYTLVQPSAVTVDIVPAVLALGGLSVSASKTYDASRVASLTGSAVVSGLNGEVVSVLGTGSGLFADANAGSGKAVTVAGLTSSDSNYVIGQQAGLTGTIAQAALTVAVSGVNRVYDGGSSASLNSANFNVGGLVGSETIGVSQTSGTFDSKNAGARSVSAILAGGDYVAGNGALLTNYLLPTSASGSATITAKSVTLTAPTVSKVYDGGLGYVTTADNLTSLSAALVGGDTVSAATLAFTDKNAGSGNRGVSLNSATVSDGNNGANYAVSYAGNSVSTITPRTLTVSATGVNRVYDAGTNASVTLGDDRVVGDVLSLSNTGASFVDKNAGLAKAMTVSGIGKAGTDSANYVLSSTTASTTADIARAALTVTGVGAVARAYDSGLGVALSGTPVVQALGNDVVTVQGSASGTLADKNAGGAKALSVAGYTTLDNNYYLVQPQGLTVDITPAVLALGGLQVAVTKTYDGTRLASLSGSAVVSGINGEVVSVLGTGSGLFADANAGSGKAVTVAGFTSSDSNYVIGQQAGLTGTIAKAALTVAVNGVSRVYDGGSSASLVSGNFSVGGLVGSETIGVSQTSGTFDSKNAGARSVSAILAGGDFVAGNGALLTNYLLPTSASGSATITAKSVTLTAPTVSKVYDGGLGYVTTAGNLTSLSGALVGGDSVTAASLSFADKNAGSGNRSVSLNSATVNDGNNGANYRVTLAGNSGASITPRTLAVSATGVNRVYDAGTNASVTLGDDRVVGDVLSLSNTGARFVDKNAGLAKAIIVSGIGKTGIDSANYVLASTTTSATADIARADLLLGGVSAVARAYNAGTAVTIAGTPTVTPLGNDVVVVGGSAVGTLADKNAGLNKAVTVAGYTINDANYRLLAPAGVTVTIAPAVLALNGLSVAASKTYDGSRNVTLTGSASVTGLNGEVVSVLGSSVGQFADKNAGSGKAIIVSGLQASDSNYSIGQQAGLTGTIVPASLAISGVTANDKLFDGSVGASLSGSARVSALGGDAVSVAGTPVARFASAEAGIGKAVTVSGYTLAGADAGNYSAVQPAGLFATINADATLVPPPVVLAAPVLPTPPLTARIADPAPVLAPAPAAAPGASVVTVLTTTEAPVAVAPAGSGTSGTSGASIPTSASVIAEPGASTSNSASTSSSVASPVQGNGLIAGAGTSVAASSAASTGASSSGIVVSLVREPLRQQSGMVTVSVPTLLVQAGAGFSFPLPTRLVEAAAVSRVPVQASTASGAALPSWLTFDNASKTFTATAAPAGSLPLQVLLTIGTQRALIMISESGR
ncbi:YDG domain-containing protein [Massilia sp. DWR3-1-1]|uniref:YDG domain-containing protein n=1 Tax=Massilia sp. DWR3-1-1 TaxID=2804559 RepID=UPI003CF8898C